MKYICFDIGGTKILKAVLEINRKKFKILDEEEEKNPRNASKITKLLLDYCLSSKKKYGTNKVAISTAKIVNPRKKLVENATHCYGKNVFRYSFLEKNGFELELENDGRCFALGEYYFGKASGAESALTLTLGTGIGGGFISCGKNLQGNHFSAMEISFIKYYFNNKYSAWENLAAGRGIESAYFRMTTNKIRSEEIFLKAKQKDKITLKVISQAEVILGIGISNLINILDPEIVVFGGGISKQKIFLENAIKVAKRNIFNKKAHYKFYISSLGSKANLLGAAMNFQGNSMRS